MSRLLSFSPTVLHMEMKGLWMVLMANDQENPLMIRHTGKLPWGQTLERVIRVFGSGRWPENPDIYLMLDTLVISFFLADFCNLTYFLEGAIQLIICSHSWKVILETLGIVEDSIGGGKRVKQQEEEVVFLLFGRKFLYIQPLRVSLPVQ